MVEDTAIDRTRPWAMAMPMRPTWPLVRASVQMAPAPMKHRANVPINSATHSFQAIRIADTSLGFAGGTRGNGPAGWSGHNLPEARPLVNSIVFRRGSGRWGGRQRGAAPASVKWLVTVKIVYGSRQFLSDRRASGSARFLTLLFALNEGDTWSPAHGAVRWVRGAISLAALDSGQT